jgi:hypothetical protein
MFYLGSATDLGITVSLAIALCGQGKTEVEVSLKHGWCITVAAGTYHSFRSLVICRMELQWSN